MFFFDRSIYMWHTYVVAQILNRLGYIVDLINWNDTKFLPKRNYDLYFAHGGMISEKIMDLLSPSAVRIYWTSIMYWQYHNDEELKRLRAIEARRGVMLPVDRFVHHSEDGALSKAHGIIGLGNHFIRETYRDFPNVTMVNNMARPVDGFETESKDFRFSRDHFLYFAGAGAVQKGLDLLLEVFAELEHQHLWVAGPVESEFIELYRSELLERPNIHFLGIIRPRGPDFLSLMQKCCYVISASSGEGQPHSVIECMAYGLIPVVSVPNGIDVEDFGVMIEPCAIDHVSGLVATLANWDPERCLALSTHVRDVVAEKYSEAAFTRNVTAAIESILADSPIAARTSDASGSQSYA